MNQVEVRRSKARLIGHIWPFVAMVLVQLMIAGLSLYTMSAVRAYVGGESLWSKGQKEAIYFLNRYAETQQEYFYRRYREAIAVPLGDRQARLELDKPAPDLAVARAGLLAGGNDPEDIDGMIWLYRNFRGVSYMARSIRYWTAADGIILDLDRLAQQLHAEITDGTATPGSLNASRAELYNLNSEITPLARGYATSLGEGSRMIRWILLAANLFSAALLIVLAGVRIMKLLAQRRAFEHALHAEKERIQITLASIGEAVVSTNVDGCIDFMNPVAERLFGRTESASVGRQLAPLLDITRDETRTVEGDIVRRTLQGETVTLADRPRLLNRTDESTVAVSLVGTPLRIDGVVAGAVFVLHDRTSELELISRLSWQASHDVLTNLANRREFESRLERALAHHSLTPGNHALMFLDLDQFKVINDTCGHAAGDQLLREVSETLRSTLPGSALLARLGGDEFGVLLENCPPETALQVAQELCNAIKANRFMWSGRLFNVTASIGLVHAGETHVTLEETLSAADVACYIAKEKGRDRVQLHRPGDTELQQRFGEMEWVQKLQRAIEGDQFKLFAQEIVPLGETREIGAHVEILLRLVDEFGTMIPPGSFVPVAERYGLMPSVDRWVVRNTFARLAERNHAGAQPLSTCAINLSGTSFADEGFPEYVREQAAAYGISPATICFEVTETSAIADLERARRYIGALKALGCRFSLDDFGSGMSSFGYLKNLPIDYLKIDGGFVRDMLRNRVDRAMVEMMGHVGKVTGKQTIAECVEDGETLSVLRDIGIDHAQGYAIERPRPFDADTVFVMKAPLGVASATAESRLGVRLVAEGSSVRRGRRLSSTRGS